MKTTLSTSENVRTLIEESPGAYAGLEELYRIAAEAVRDPRYIRASRKVENETLHSWGIEMLFYGISSGYKLARCHMREEEIASCLANPQTFGDFEGTVTQKEMEGTKNDDKAV